ncbi:hypothetical protein ACM66B_006756 [Microbotryomycetes sp. NB124-2]
MFSGRNGPITGSRVPVTITTRVTGPANATASTSTGTTSQQITADMPRSSRSASAAQQNNVATPASGSSRQQPPPATGPGLIDLTDSSPPLANRGLALPLPPTNANAQAGPSTVPARHSARASTSAAAAQDAIVLSSDSEGDEDADIMVFEPAPNARGAQDHRINLRPSTARRLNVGAVAPAVAGAGSNGGTPDLDADFRLARELQAEEARNFAAPIGIQGIAGGPLRHGPPAYARRGGGRAAPYVDGPPQAVQRGIFRRLTDIVRDAFGEERDPAPVLTPAQRIARYLPEDPEDFLGLGRALFAINGMWDAEPARGGFWPGVPRPPKVKPAKRYTVKLSHPRKPEPGFTRDIVSEEDALEKIQTLKQGGSGAQGDNGSKKRRRGGAGSTAAAIKQAEADAELEPVCSSCLRPLFLAQSGDGRMWALKCGHVVCGQCLTGAQERCREIRKQERDGRWQMDVDGPAAKAKRTVFVDDSDDDENDPDFYIDSTFDDEDEDYRRGRKNKNKRQRKNPDDDEEDPQLVVSSSASSSNPKKGKSKSRADETGVEEEWTTCPVASCSGHGTNLLAPQGSVAGAFPVIPQCVPDAELTPDGREQSKKLHEDTKDTVQQQAQVLLVSPLRRTMQTALIGYATLRERVSTILEPALQEVNDLPCDTGSPREKLELDPTFSSLDLSPLDLAPIKHDGASWTSKKGFFAPDRVKERAKYVRRLLRDRKEDKIVVVAHGDILRYIVYGENTHEPWGNTETLVYKFKNGADDEDAWLEEIKEVAKEGEDEPTSSDMKN